MFKLKTLSSAILLGLVTLTSAYPSPPLDLPSNPQAIANNPFIWKRFAAENALQSGLFTLAETLYSEVLQQPHLEPEARRNIALDLTSTLIRQKKYKEAQKILRIIENADTPSYFIRSAIVHFYLDEQDTALSAIKKIKPDSLSPDDLPWYHLLQGLIAQKQKKFKDIRPHLINAHKTATSDAQRAQIDALLVRESIFSGKADEALARKLQKKINRSEGRAELKLYKEYAIVLDLIDQKDEAIQILEDCFINSSSYEKLELDSTLILIGLIAGNTSEKGIEVFQKLLDRKGNSVYLKIALSLLVEAQLASNNADTLIAFLDQLLTAHEDHPIMDNLLLLRAQLALSKNDFETASLHANSIVEKFPGSINKARALRLLTYIAWNAPKPRYRTAANTLIKLQKDTPHDAPEHMQLSLMIADCYFLNRDYENAANIYLTLLKENTPQLPSGAVLFQLVLSKLKCQKLDEAQNDLDTLGPIVSIDPLNRWRSEWSLINAMKNQGNIASAFLRISNLLESPSKKSVPPELKLRLMWLKAQLSLESDNASETPALVDAIMHLLESLDSHSLTSQQLELIASNSLLLKAQGFLRNKATQEALSILKTLREAYPNSDPAVLSYIIEARHFSSLNHTAEAQRLLVKLADRYPNSQYTPIALYEAALNSESRELNSTYQEAINILERLIDNYPDTPLAYYARLEQGDILRKLNDFSAAQLIYENLINTFPNHPEQFRPEFSRADCLLAQSSKDPTRLKEAAAIFERLFDLPQLPADLCIQAGYKHGFTLTKMSNAKQAQKVFWLVISKFLIDNTHHESLGDQGRYWITRTIFNLGSLFEDANLTAQANQIYTFIEEYNLPGNALAQSKIK